MAIELTLTTTKPAAATWWWNTNPDKMAAIDTWVQSRPGFVSYSQSLTNKNVRVQKITFDTQENLDNYTATIYQCPEAVERKAYNDANKITTVSKTTIQ